MLRKTKIAICGSMSFAKEMLEIKKKLGGMGYKVVIQSDIEKYVNGIIHEEDKWRKIKYDVFKNYFNEIKKCDAILVVNIDRNNIKNYVGGNSLIEMAFAHVLNKKIFLLNPIPTRMSYTNEIKAMKPIILRGNLKKIR